MFEDVVSEVDTEKYTKRDQEKGHERAPCAGDLQMLQ